MGLAHTGISLENYGHKPDCKCTGCKAKRREFVGDNNLARRSEVRTKISVAQKITQNLPDVKAKAIIDAIEAWKDPKIRINHMEAINCPEVKNRQIASAIKRYEDPKEHEKTSAALKGNPNLIIAITKLWQDSEYRENQLKAIFKGLDLKPNKSEKFLMKLLNKLFPKEWKYVGDGSLLIGYKNPDFVNNQNNKIIELFGDYWHSEERTGKKKEINEQERIDLFIKCGYQTLIIWEYELKNVNYLKEKLFNFN
jgi:G:T-mismatch repair DNA endonuclease (very short patch repair protein)